MAEKKTVAKKGAAKKVAGPKETFKIIHKRSGRWAVMDRATRKWINGEEKLKILVSKGIIKVKLPEATPAAEESATPAES